LNHETGRAGPAGNTTKGVPLDGSGCIYEERTGARAPGAVLEEFAMPPARLPRTVGTSGPLLLVALIALTATSLSLLAQAPATSAGDVTFARDIAPILQRSCQQCHRADGVAPMSLATYEEVRPWARAIRTRTTLRSQRGAMPPWFIEKNIGIQRFKDDPSLSDEEVGKIARWADSGAPRGDPADMPRPVDFANTAKWTIGDPDLVLRSPEVVVAASAPDKWGSLGLVPTGLAEDRYVAALEVKEVNDIPKDGSANTVGGRYGFHHMTYASVVPGKASGDNAESQGGTTWPVHEVGRNADIFPPEAGRLLAAGSALSLNAYHLHSNGRDTRAHLEFAFKFFPRGYKPLYRNSSLRLGNGVDIDVKPNQANQELHAYATLQEHTKIISFEPHMHAQGTRMCLEAIWGYNIQTLNCVGYDHNWVKQYVYADEAAPLLPKGTILHLIGFLDTTAANRNVVDPRNWSGAGRRSVANMFIDLGYSVALTEEQFQAEMTRRRSRLEKRNDYDIGCPLCWAPPIAPRPQTTGGQGNQP
jgi:mono/diheme cytochrome c family protein